MHIQQINVQNVFVESTRVLGISSLAILVVSSIDDDLITFTVYRDGYPLLMTWPWSEVSKRIQSSKWVKRGNTGLLLEYGDRVLYEWNPIECIPPEKIVIDHTRMQYYANHKKELEVYAFVYSNYKSSGYLPVEELNNDIMRGCSELISVNKNINRILILAA